MKLFFIVIMIYHFFLKYSQSFIYFIQRSNQISCKMLQNDKEFDPNQIEIIRLIGKMDIRVDENTLTDARKEIQRLGDFKLMSNLESYIFNKTRVTSIRVYDVKLDNGKKCFLKEYLPMGLSFGRREYLVTRDLSIQWNNVIQSSTQENIDENQNNIFDNSNRIFPFPNLIGSIRIKSIDIDNNNFKSKWIKQFPNLKLPIEGNLWLLYEWDEFSFRSIKRYPSLPQIIEGLDYFNKSNRDIKRWKFIRKIIKKCLESLDVLHNIGYCHNVITSECIWLSTTNQLEINTLNVKITELGTCQQLKSLGPYAKEGIIEDYYQLGFVFLELIISSFNDDNNGAIEIRNLLLKNDNNIQNIFYKKDDINLSQLNHKEIQDVFEILCNSNLESFLQVISGIKSWEYSKKYLENDDFIAWKLILRLLTRGNLYNETRTKQIRLTGKSLIKRFNNLFQDV